MGSGLGLLGTSTMGMCDIVWIRETCVVGECDARSWKGITDKVCMCAMMLFDWMTVRRT